MILLERDSQSKGEIGVHLKASRLRVRFVKTFFDSFSHECNEQVDRLLDKKASSVHATTLDDFVHNTLTEWNDQLGKKYGYPALGSMGWLFQVLIGKLLLCYINKLLDKEAKREKTKSKDPSWYHIWELNKKRIILSIDTRLSSISDNLEPIRVDIAVIVERAGVEKVEVYLETKTYPNQAVEEISKAYSLGLKSIKNETVIGRLIFWKCFGENSQTPKKFKKRGIHWICIENGKGKLDELFQEIKAKLDK